MGKSILSEHSNEQHEDNHPGCMWSVLDILGYHYWPDVKKLLPHKWPVGLRLARCYRRRKASLDDLESKEEKELGDVEADDLIIRSSTKTSPSQGRSGKDWIRAKKGHIYKVPGIQLIQTDSIHQLDPSDHFFGRNPPVYKSGEESVASNNKCDVCDHANVVDFSGKHAHFPEKYEKIQTLSNQQHMFPTQHKDASCHHIKEFTDVLEIFKVNKELFLNFLHEPNLDVATHFHNQRSSNVKVRLTKSGSFPVAELSNSRNFSSSKLDHKQKELWPFEKGNKLFPATQALKLSAAMKLKTSMADDSVGSMIKQDSSSSSLDSIYDLNNGGRNQVVINRFKDIKKRIKQVIKKSKKESKRTTMDALLHRVPSGHGFSRDGSEVIERWKAGSKSRDSKESCKMDGTVHNLEKGGVHQIRRTSSLNESLDRYAQLFERSFGKDHGLRISKSLKLTNEDGFELNGHGSKSFRRILSVHDLEYYNTLLEVSHDVLYSGMPGIDFADGSKNVGSSNDDDDDDDDESKYVNLPKCGEKCVPLDAVEIDAAGSTKVVNEVSASKLHEHSEDRTEENMFHQEHKTGLWKNSKSELVQPGPVAVLETSFQVSELATSCIHLDEPDPSINTQKMSSVDILSGSCDTVDPVKVENANLSADCSYQHMKLHGEYADFNYVRDDLELTGLIENEHFGSWQDLNKLLNSSVFEEMEACLLHEPECSVEVVNGICDRQLLFDLVNEALLEFNDRSFTYLPRTLSLRCHSHPKPKRYQALEEVWNIINRYLLLRAELPPSRDSIVAQDMARSDGWMNLQSETEFVALELEDLIFNELLDEVTCF